MPLTREEISNAIKIDTIRLKEEVEKVLEKFKNKTGVENIEIKISPISIEEVNRINDRNCKNHSSKTNKVKKRTQWVNIKY